MYDLNQIHYDYTMQVMNRLKGLDLVDRLPGELWIEGPNILQEAVTKTKTKKRKCKMTKWLYEEDLQIANKRKKMKRTRQRRSREHLL